MANRASLLNTAFLTSDPFLLSERLQQPGNDYAEVATASYLIPVPWLCCFRPQDIRPVNVPMEEGEPQQVGLPCTSVKQAIANLEAALPLFEAIAGDANIGRAYWRSALEYLRILPLPYLALNPIEVIFMGEPAEYCELMRQAMSGDAAAIPHLKELSSFEAGAPPYPRDVLYSVPGKGHDKRRMTNAVALDHGIYPGSYFWSLSPGSSEPPEPALPAPPEPDLTTLHAEILALVRASQPDGSIYYGFLPRQGAGETLKMLITADTDAQRAALLADGPLQAALNGPLRAKLEAVCHRHGFAWAGYYFGSDETRERDFKGDYEYWRQPVVERAAGAVSPAAAAAKKAAADAPEEKPWWKFW